MHITVLNRKIPIAVLELILKLFEILIIKKKVIKNIKNDSMKNILLIKI